MENDYVERRQRRQAEMVIVDLLPRRGYRRLDTHRIGSMLYVSYAKNQGQ